MMKTTLAVLLALGVALVALPVAAFELVYEGSLTDQADAPFDGTVTAHFALFTAATDGEQLWEESHEIDVADGVLVARLGSVTELPADPPDGLWLEITVNDDTLTPRSPVGGVLFAQRAAVADDVPGRDITPRTVSIQGVGEVIDAEGVWVGGLAAGDSDDDGFSDVTEMLVGTDPASADDAPDDENADGVPDVLVGSDGPAGAIGERGEQGSAWGAW